MPSRTAAATGVKENSTASSVVAIVFKVATMGDDEEVFQDILAWFVCLTDPLIPDGGTQPSTSGRSTWLLAHGDEGGLRQIAGTTAAGLAQRWQKNVVCGHSHRAGLVPTSYGVLGNQKTLWGLEVGNLMDLKKASYLRPAQAANWQQAFGLVHVTQTGRKTIITPEIRWIVNGTVSRGLEAS